jgi:Spy/CpxP family protein refolding chaperone
MTTEELVIQKLRELNPEQQQQVWEFINSLSNPQPSITAQSRPFGEKLRELRAQIVASGIPLLNDEELDREIAERRGGINLDELL